MNVLDYLGQFNKFGSGEGFKPGLERMEALLEAFDHPQDKLNVVHVAGSNGKGSTIAFMKSIYRQVGYDVGTFISPPLNSFGERIMINDTQISHSKLEELIQKIDPVVEKIKQKPGKGVPTFFEIATLLAILYFAQESPDLVLLETGLGGRLDATNVVAQPQLTVITEISQEHTSLLGTSLVEIAREKAGIIKQGVPVITGVSNPAAETVICRQAKKKQAPIIFLRNKYDFEVETINPHYQFFMCKQQKSDGSINNFGIKTGLIGNYQGWNALLAREAVLNLQEKFPVSNKQIKDGLKKAFWPGRMEILTEEPLIIADGAHNPEAVNGLVEVLQQFCSDNSSIYLVYSVLKDKDIEQMLKELLPLKSELYLLITNNGNPRAEKPKKIAQKAGQINLQYDILSDFNTACQESINLAAKDDIICVTGSLSTVAGGRSFFGA